MLLILRSRKVWLSCLIVGALGAQLWLYHIMFSLGGFSRGCPCLGTIAQRLPFSQTHIEKALLLAASWLCLGGCVSSYISVYTVEEISEPARGRGE
jgi:hypothetical protein